MSILFITALVSTFQFISGLTLKDFYVLGEKNDQVVKEKPKEISIPVISKRHMTFEKRNIPDKDLSTQALQEEQDSSSLDVQDDLKLEITDQGIKSGNMLDDTVSLMKEEPIELSKQIAEFVDWSKFQTDTVVATGYTAGYESTGKNPDHPAYGITYSGIKVKRDFFSTIAADLSIYPLGTILYIPGYGYGVVADKGGAIKGKKLDLYYDTVEDVYTEWGKRKVEIYVIKKGNGKLSKDEFDQMNRSYSKEVYRFANLKKDAES